MNFLKEKVNFRLSLGPKFVKICLVHYNEDGTSGVPMFYSFPSRYSDGYKNELNHFLDVVQVR